MSPANIARLRAFHRRMARFELDRARTLRDAGRADRARYALTRAKLWRNSSNSNGATA